jgi:hypothetical protein
MILRRKSRIEQSILKRNIRRFNAEVEKLENWADDLKLGLESEIKDLDREIKDARRAAGRAPSLEEKLVGQKIIKALELKRNEKRRSLFDAQDEVDRQREKLITEIEGKLTQKVSSQFLFRIGWNLI